MATGVENLIVVKGMDKGHHDEGILDSALYPGMAVELKSNGHYDAPAGTQAATLKRALKILKEDALNGRTKSTQYASGDVGFLYTPIVGDHILAYVKTGADIAVGDTLVVEAGGSGKFVESAGTETKLQLKALESTSGALAADALVKCEVVSC